MATEQITIRLPVERVRDLKATATAEHRSLAQQVEHRLTIADAPPPAPGLALHPTIMARIKEVAEATGASVPAVIHRAVAEWLGPEAPQASQAPPAPKPAPTLQPRPATSQAQLTAKPTQFPPRLDKLAKAKARA